jgi:hypothetical protein
MTGGRFDYNQHKLCVIADDIEAIKRFDESVGTLSVAEIYIQRFGGKNESW